jgi:hypothetical protein
MGKASSSKKVARAARAGGSRRVGQRRNLGFPFVIVAVIGLGLALVVFARNDRAVNASPAVYTGESGDHWHAAYGVNICGQEQPPMSDGPAGDPLGIHSHGDGIIHIHPFLRSAAGQNADIGVFFDTVEIQVDDDRIVLPDGTEFVEGEEQCDGEDAQVQVAVWNSAEDAANGEEPARILTDDFSSIRFRDDREAYTIAFLPEGDEIPAPTSVPTLDSLSDVVNAPTTTTPDGITTTTAPGATTTSVPATTTTAPSQ